MAQKPVLRGEVGCACVAREVSVESLGPTIRRKTKKVNARLPVSSNLDTLSKELPTRNVEERQRRLEQVLRRHALRVGLCVFQQIFKFLVVDRFLDLLEGSAARVDLDGDSLVHLVPHPGVREAEEQAHVLREAVVVYACITRLHGSQLKCKFHWIIRDEVHCVFFHCHVPAQYTAKCHGGTVI